MKKKIYRIIINFNFKFIQILNIFSKMRVYLLLLFYFYYDYFVVKL